MEEQWKTSKISTPERIFRKINNRMAQPVGIVLFGADCDLKNDAFSRCAEEIHNLVTGYGDGGMPLRAAGQVISDGKNVLTAMSGETSGDLEQRQLVVATLKDLGVKTVVGFYVKYIPIWHGNIPETDNDIANHQAWALLNRPPVESEFDLMVTRESSSTSQGLGDWQVIS